MSRVDWVTVDNLGSGVNDYEPVESINPSEAPNTMRNIRGEGVAFRPRKGYSKFADEKSSVTVRAMGMYTRNASSNDKMVRVLSDNTLETIDPVNDSTWTNVALGGVLTDNTDVNLANYGDYLFVFNGVDKPIRIEGTTVTQDFVKPDSIASANDFLPLFGEVFYNSLFVSGVPTAPNTVFISKTALTDVPENIYDFSGSLTGYGNADELLFPERVTAIRLLSDALVVFTTNNAWYIPGLSTYNTTVTFSVKPIVGSSGCVRQDACVSAENDVFYMTPQKEIKSIRRDFSDNLSVIMVPISENIQRFLNDEVSNDLSTCFALYDAPERTVEFFMKKSNGTHNYYRIVGDLRNLSQAQIPEWYIDDSMAFSCGVYCNMDGKQKSYLGSPVIGQCYTNNNGLADHTSAIITKRPTKRYTLGNNVTIKKFYGCYIYGKITNYTVLTVKIYIDGVLFTTEQITNADIPSGEGPFFGGIGTEDIGSFVIGEEGGGSNSELDEMEAFTKHIPFRQRGKNIQFEFSTDGINNNFRIQQIDFGAIRTARSATPIIEK